MKNRHLAQDLNVGAIGYGAMGLSEFYGETNDGQSLNVLGKLLDHGVNFIDTANLYGRGHNERLIGHFLAKLDSRSRQAFKIATKCGIDRDPDAAYARKINNSPDYIVQCCNESLQRLGVEKIDLFYLHRVDKEASIEESMQTLSGLVKEGKIGHIGLCEVSAETLKKAHAVFPVTAVQTEYSLWTRDIEESILPAIRSLEIGLAPYSPLGRGFLTGKYLSTNDFAEGDFRKGNERFQQENLDHNHKLLDAISPVTEKYGCTSGQIALAWLLAQYEKTVPIPGTKNEKYLAENAAAAEIKLDATDVDRLNTIQRTVVVSERL